MFDRDTSGRNASVAPSSGYWRRQLGVRGSYTSLYILVLVSLIFLNALVVFDAGTQDHQAVQNERRTLSAVLNARVAALASQVAENAVWTEAYNHLVVHFDRDWMNANFNDSFYKSSNADRMLLLNPDGKILHFLYRGVPPASDEVAEVMGNADLQRFAARAQMLPADPSAAASGFAIVHGQLNLAGASRIAPSDPPGLVRTTPGMIFLLTTIVDDQFLASIPSDYGFKQLRVVPGFATPRAYEGHNTWLDGFAGFWEPGRLVIGPEGDGPRVTLAWKPLRPGDAFMSVVLPPVMLLSLMVAAFGIIVVRRLQASTKLLTAAYIEAAAGNDTKSRFLTMMNHELRTPLNSVIGFAEIMGGEILGPLGHQKYREYVAHISGSGAHLLAVINDILDLSSLTGGEFVLDETSFDLDAAIQDAVVRLTPQAENAQIKLSATLRVRNGYFRGDKHRVTQILLNLISNAIKFTQAGGRVNINSRIDEEGRLVIAVSDTGIGLATADVPKALELFGQIDSDLTRRYEGTGLGLPLAKLLVELHGGELRIVGAKGVGTTVTVIFPPSRIVEPASEPFERV